MESCTPGIAGYDLVVCSLLNMWIPLIILNFTSTFMVCIGRRHLKYPCKKLHSGSRIQAIWKIIYIVIYSFCNVISYSLLCAQGQSEPCNSLFKHYVEE